MCVLVGGRLLHVDTVQGLKARHGRANTLQVSYSPQVDPLRVHRFVAALFALPPAAGSHNGEVGPGRSSFEVPMLELQVGTT